MSTANPDDRAETEPESVTISDGEIVETRQEQAMVRRSPRYLQFLIAGAVVGVIVALILTLVFPGNDEFSAGQVFGFLLLLCGVIGLTLGAVVALVLDRMLAKRAKSATVEHIVTHPAE